MMKSKQQYTPILGGFVPIAALWDGGAVGALFPSETSARWFIRTNRAELVKAEAIAIHAGRMLAHPGRFEQVAQRSAINNASRRPIAEHVERRAKGAE
jgi:hypothetical protein